MKKLLVCICTLMMAFTFASCQTSTTDSPSAPAAEMAWHRPDTESSTSSSALNLNGKWKGDVEWKTDSESGTSHKQYVIVQEGMEITILDVSEGSEGLRKSYSTLKGNIIEMESTSFYNSKGSKIFYPARKLYISKDGNTITAEFDGIWQEAENREGPVSIKGTLIRE